jgi:Zn-dependent protease/predicted transcriptional regulator
MNGERAEIKPMRSFGQFQVAGITIGFDYSWFIIFGLVLLALSGGYFPHYYPGYRTQTYWIAGIFATLCFFASLVIYELAHSLVAIRAGIEIKEITLFIFGGVSRITEEPKDPVTEFKIAAVGPLASFALAVVFWIIMKLFAGFQLILLTGIFYYLAWINLALGIFNLIPGFPLDGGRLFRALFWWRTGSLTRATRVAADLGKGFAMALMILGGILIFRGDLIGGIWFIFIGMFLRGMSQRGYEEVVIRRTLENVPVREIMTREVVTVTANLSLYELIYHYFLQYPYRGFPVKDDGRILGMISLNQVKDLPPGEYPVLSIKDFVTRLSDDMVISPEGTLDEAMKQMTQKDLDRLLVMQQGELVGLITRKSLLRFVEIKQILEPEPK